ncbi:kelch repeat-containing protein, partial [Archangium sp.]|uniref:kelch repeat-containing protein n=1 Tax=Archangium sp. TaxID=1872627 RepID=UPI00286D5AFB
KSVASSAAPLVGVGWEGTGAMAEARKYHAGVVLPSGKVLVAGGYNASGYLSSATVYEPGTGSWTAVAAMPEARQAHTATVLNTGKVLVAGGENASGRLASAAVYEPATNTWASVGTFASGVARDALTATVLPSGKVLVAGGGNTAGSHSRVDVYDPVAGSWSLGANMGTARRNHTATLLPSGQVLVVGGRGSASLATAEVYEPGSNKWTATGALTTARYNHTATLLASGKVLVVGGRNSTGLVGTAEEYDPSTGTWSAAGALGSTREFHTATLMSTGKVLVAGGQNGSALGSAEEYEPGTKTWSATTTPMGGARSLHVAVALEGKVLVVGGVGATGASQKTAEVYAYDACAGVSCNSAPGTCYEAAGTCGNGVCSYAPKASGVACDDGNACTGADACNGAGVCAGSATSCSSPPGQCYEAAGACSGGSCSYEYKASGAACNDGDACTVGEVCNGVGGCAGTPVSCNSPPGQCYQAAGTCSGGTCSYAPKAAGTACDDGNAGTLNDVCSGAGVCAGAVACTTPPDACHGTPGTYANGACTYPVKEGGTVCGAGQVCNATGQCQSGCWIGGAYYAAGTTNPSVACQECNPGVSTSGWSNKAVGTTCGAPASGAWGSCGGFSDTCDETGSQSRTVTAYACTSSGTCAGSDSSETQVCTRGTAGTACGTSTGAWGSCEGFNDYCDTTGTQSRTVTDSTCGAGTCSASSTSTETQACTRPAPNTSCAAPSYGGWSACSFSDVCANTGTQSRTVTSYGYNCASGTCVASTSTETQSCTRPSPTGSCGPTSYGGWGTCERAGNYCSTSGTQSRSVTSYTCGGGTCNASNSTQSQTCPVSPASCSAPSYGAWSACSFGDVCSNTGTQTRTVTNYNPNCSTGQCVASSSTESQTCTRPSPTGSCGGTSYGSWGSCGGFSNYCDSTGTQSRSVTSYSCGSGSCNGSNGSETQGCTRTAPGPTSCSAPAPSYGAWSACGGFSDTCDETGTQSRTVTTYSSSGYNCATGSCGPVTTSISTETQACSRYQGGTYCGTSYGTWGSCGGFNDYCDASGTQSRAVTTLTCGGGTCNPSSSSSEAQACSRVAPGPQSCQGPSYGAWSACNPTISCGQGTQSRTVTNYSYSCGSGTCVPSSFTETQACTIPGGDSYTLCSDGSCVDTSNDDANCGYCGRVCPTVKYNICMNGRCCYTESNCL